MKLSLHNRQLGRDESLLGLTKSFGPKATSLPTPHDDMHAEELRSSASISDLGKLFLLLRLKVESDAIALGRANLRCFTSEPMGRLYSLLFQSCGKCSIFFFKKK